MVKEEQFKEFIRNKKRFYMVIYYLGKASIHKVNAKKLPSSIQKLIMQRLDEVYKTKSQAKRVYNELKKFDRQI